MFGTNLMNMIAKRARLREKSYKENVKLALCLTAPMFFILSVGLHCMTFLQELVNDKINGDHPLRLELGPTTGRCPWLNMAPDFALSCSFTCLLDCPTQCFILLRVTQDQIHALFFFPPSSWPAVWLSQYPLKRFSLLVSKMPSSSDSLLFLSFFGCSFSSYHLDLGAF